MYDCSVMFVINIKNMYNMYLKLGKNEGEIGFGLGGDLSRETERSGKYSLFKPYCVLRLPQNEKRNARNLNLN